MIRSKPGIETAPGDYLDETSEAFAEEEHSRHCEHKCMPHCQYCELEADLEREGKVHDLLNVTLALTYKALEPKRK